MTIIDARVLAIALLGCSAGALPQPRVQIDAGLVEGVATPGGAAFLGIPYAAPPLGDARWRPPRPIAPWSGVRAARSLGPTCPQRDMTERRRRVAVALGEDPDAVPPAPPMSEDCLTLNVWTTNLGGGPPRPVIVWLHGGSNTTGSGGDEAASLTDDGVVVVTLNYRLGLLGFLAHPALGAESPHRVSGNYGLLDQIEALRWVQRNIAGFGGDPTRVTAIGHSAGGGAVLQLLASPLARDLVHRGIAQSGTLDMSRPLRAAEADGIATATTLGASPADPLPVLRAATVEHLLAVQPRGIQCTTDGWVLPRPVPELLRTGGLDRVPLIIGATADEADIFAIPSIDRDAFAEHVRTDVLALSPTDLAVRDRVDRLLALYPSSRDATPAMRRYMTDRDFVCPARYAAARRGGRTWLYRFSLPAARMGAFHGAELPVLFGTRGGRVGDAMRRYWIRFAIAGDPNEPGLPAWPVYSEAPARHLELGDRVRVTDRFDRPACEMHDEVWSGR